MNSIKELTFKKKIEYIWDYYKWHIFISIVTIVIISGIVYSSNHHTDYVFNVSILGYFNKADFNNAQKYEKSITDIVVNRVDQKSKQAIIEIYPLNKSSDTLENLDPNYTQKFTTKLLAGEIDILILDKEDFNKFSKEDYFIELNDIINLKSNSLKYGVSVNGNKMLNSIGYDTADKVAAIVSTTKQKEKAIKVLKWLLNFQT